MSGRSWDLKISDISPIEQALFHRLLHLLICIAVLACPATGGWCCGEADAFQDASAAVSGGCECCCQQQAAPSENNVPISPPCPDQCHDCICAGALPPAFETPMPQTNCDGCVAFVVRAMDQSAYRSVVVRPGHRNNNADGFQSPSGRALLTAYCTLLL